MKTTKKKQMTSQVRFTSDYPLSVMLLKFLGVPSEFLRSSFGRRRWLIGSTEGDKTLSTRR